MADSDNKTAKVCHFGDKCYRKNPQHIKDFHGSKRKQKDDESPPKNKKTLDDFFMKANKKAKDDLDQKSTAQEDAGEDSSGYIRAEETEPCDATSGYVRKDEDEEDQETCDNSSGYVRNKDDDQDKDDTATAAETDDAPSPIDIKENIKQKFLVEMPEDFYEFWEFCKSLDKKSPKDALQKTLGLQLVGPYDVLAGLCVKKNGRGKTPCYLTHWRYYYDPPEFLTVLRGDDETQFHMGYFRDDPKELPAFVASNAAKSNCTITPRGLNVFAAVSWYLQDILKKEKNASKKKILSQLKEKLENWADKKSYPLEQKSKQMKERDKKVVCKSFHGAGIVVPVDANDVGYREVPETPADLKKMFKRISESKSDEERNKHFDPLMELVTLIQFANDECDYGEGLELGIDLFCYGGEVFHGMIQNLLGMAYMLLGRHEFGDIIKAHLSNRSHSADLSEID